MKTLKLFLIVVLSNVLLIAQEEKVYNSPEIVITGSKVPTPIIQLNRSAQIITQKEIRELSVISLPELLNYALGVDVKQRGAYDVQSDISIRGGSFEQTLILLNGIKLNDPQTGHHNMNIPISLNDIERIEILRGAGSSIHGANALTGVINIITKQNSFNSFSSQVSYGSFGFYNLEFNTNINTGILHNAFTISKSHSNGYIHNTNFDNIKVNYSPRIVLQNGVINFLAGYQDKKFGANGFYSDKYPNQYEETKTTLFAINSDFAFNNFNISPKISYRKHKDFYLLDYLRPSFYKNNHQTDSYNFQLEANNKNILGVTAIGVEYGIDKINSSNLGNHQRNKYGFSLEQKSELLKAVDVSFGGYLYKYDTFGYKFIPAINIGINITDNLRFISSYGKSFRLPTFTELYYSSPAQVGNPLLHPEETWSVESGIKYNSHLINSQLSLYFREGTNLIDWAKQNVNDKWKAENIAKLRTYGVEYSISAALDKIIPQSFVNTVSFGYSYIYINNNQINYISKYVLEHLKNQFTLNLFNTFPLDIKNAVSMRYDQRINTAGYFICDTKFSKQINNFELSFSINNIFNRYYKDFNNIPLPGINFIGELRYSLTEK